MKKKIMIFLCILFVAGCTSTSARQINLVDKNVNPEPYNRIRTIFQSMPAIELVKQKYRFAIADYASPNAFVSSKDKILVVHKGLLDVMDDEELTLIMFHENAHVKYSHAGKNMASSYATSAVFTIANIFLPGVGYADYVVNPMITTAYSREQELEADRDAVEMGAGMSIPAAKYISALNKLKQYAVEKRIGDTERTGLFDTHPNIEYRINEIKRKTGTGEATPE